MNNPGCFTDRLTQLLNNTRAQDKAWHLTTDEFNSRVDTAKVLIRNGETDSEEFFACLEAIIGTLKPLITKYSRIACGTISEAEACRSADTRSLLSQLKGGSKTTYGTILLRIPQALRRYYGVETNEIRMIFCLDVVAYLYELITTYKVKRREGLRVAAIAYIQKGLRNSMSRFFGKQIMQYEREVPITRLANDDSSDMDMMETLALKDSLSRRSRSGKLVEGVGCVCLDSALVASVYEALGIFENRSTRAAVMMLLDQQAPSVVARALKISPPELQTLYRAFVEEVKELTRQRKASMRLDNRNGALVEAASVLEIDHSDWDEPGS